MLHFGFAAIVTNSRHCLPSDDEMSSLAWPIHPKPLHQRVKSRAIHSKPSGGTCGSADDSVRIVGKVRSHLPTLISTHRWQLKLS